MREASKSVSQGNTVLAIPAAHSNHPWQIGIITPLHGKYIIVFLKK